MSFRFWRRIQILPGITLNLSKSGASISLGPRGAKLTLGPRGARATVGLPGTGLFYTTKLGSRKRKQSPVPVSGGPASGPPTDRLNLGFLQRLLAPKEEEALVDGCRELVQGHDAAALTHLRNAVHLSDGAFLAGVLALKLGRLDEAADWLQRALDRRDELGRSLAKYGIRATVQIPITEEIAAVVEPNLPGLWLALVEVYQLSGQPVRARAYLEQLLQHAPQDPVVRVSLAELLLETQPADREACHRVVQLAADVNPESPVHIALLLYKARALRQLGLQDAARHTLNLALRRPEGCSPELVRALRYERALVYEALGETTRARREWERLYAEAPDYQDVASRVGR
ncbi:MAG: DUF4236 domain-containing protein [Verrucomicrobiota bacterium]|nr:DUF4236 domain-containing protein [Limisphaera sp.]MDW8382441.1 DUF4236 domain-containing protein [Verrucomicrobiota bacterium]